MRASDAVPGELTGCRFHYPAPGAQAAVAATIAAFGSLDVVVNEISPLGIKVTIVEPGPFRTDWAGSSMTVHPVSPDYEQTVGRMNTFREQTSRT